METKDMEMFVKKLGGAVFAGLPKCGEPSHSGFTSEGEDVFLLGSKSEGKDRLRITVLCKKARRPTCPI